MSVNDKINDNMEPLNIYRFLISNRTIYIAVQYPMGTNIQNHFYHNKPYKYLEFYLRLNCF